MPPKEKREHSKKHYLLELAKIDDENLLIIKTADRICNTEDLFLSGRKARAREYLKDAIPVVEKCLNILGDILRWRVEYFLNNFKFEILSTVLGFSIRESE